MRIGLVTIYVEDQGIARKIYTEMIGFRLHTDIPAGDDGVRWLTVVSPDDDSGIQLQLDSAVHTPGALEFQRTLKASNQPALSIRTRDCEREVERLEAAGLEVVMRPTDMPYGGIDATIDDGCGNLICLHQD